MATWLHRLLLAPALLLAAQVSAEPPEVVDPGLDRREVKVARIDNENIEISMAAGIISIEDFDSSEFLTVRAAFHINEHVFIEASYGIAEGDKTSFEEIIDTSQILSDDARDYTTYDVSVGWNVLKGETWLFGKAMMSDLYLSLGLGITDFADDNWTTLNAGVGYRLFLTDWLSWRIDVRDHVFNRDIFGEDDVTNNIELSTGLSYFF